MSKTLPLLLVAVVAGCSRSGSPVEFIVPNGYHGAIWLTIDPDAADYSYVDGRFQVVVTVGGVSVRSFEPFQSFHKETARYADGTPLPVETMASPTEVALRGGSSGVSTDGNRRTEWMVVFVGTKRQFDDWSANDMRSQMPR